MTDIIAFYLDRMRRTGLILTLAMGVSLVVCVPASWAQSEDVRWLDLSTAMEAAAEGERHVLVFIEADWCAICKNMKASVFTEAPITTELANEYVPALINLDSRRLVRFNNVELTEREFARTMEVITTPTILFLDSSGKVLARHLGYVSAERLTLLLKYVRSEDFGVISVDDFERRLDD
jgi:thioredoxin-related protein